jgi:hypothetical protein
MWEEYKPGDTEYDLYCFAIERFDYEHNIHVECYGDHFALIYHNIGEDEESDEYWGVYFSDGDCGYFESLEIAKEISSKILKLID